MEGKINNRIISLDALLANGIYLLRLRDHQGIISQTRLIILD
jgi:hypothetical protein